MSKRLKVNLSLTIKLLGIMNMMKGVTIVSVGLLLHSAEMLMHGGQTMAKVIL